MATTEENRVRFGLQWPAAGVKRQRGPATGTAGNQEIGRLYFLYSHATLCADDTATLADALEQAGKALGREAQVAPAISCLRAG